MEKRKSINELSPTEFEEWCMKVLTAYAEEEGLKELTISHDRKIRGYDGKYQIDILAEFIALGTSIKILCECKRYKNTVKREKVAILKEKLESIGAQKGILISTSGFQRGAIEYARTHGIALIKVEDYRFEYLSHASGQKAPDDDPFLYAERHMPPFVAYDYSSGSNDPRKIYPTREMISNLLIEMNRKIKETMGIEIELNTDRYFL